MSNEPRYSQDQVETILRRAAELQAQSLGPGESRGGMTLDEVEAAAAEAGLDRALVRRAATDVAGGGGGSAALVEADANRARPWLGGPLEWRIERTVPGEFPVESFDRLGEVLRLSGLEHGQVSVVGRSLTWTSGAQHDGMPTTTTVIVSVRDGVTRVRLRANFRPLVGGYFGGIGGGVGGGVGWIAFGAGAVVAGPVGSVVLGLGFLGGVYALCRGLYHRTTLKRRATMQRVADELERVIKGELSVAP